MPEIEIPRSITARMVAERALARVICQYGGRSEFILLGGQVPSLPYTQPGARHAGSTDIDLLVNLDFTSNPVKTARLEQALLKAGCTPDEPHIWRWRSPSGPQAVIKLELIADLASYPAGTIMKFDGCQELGAVNLWWTGLAGGEVESLALTTMDEGVRRHGTLYVTGLAGFLMAKVAAAWGRRKAKDWYDIAFVLLHNDHGDAVQVARRVQQRFGLNLESLSDAITDLRANFDSATAQGTLAYVDQFCLDHPEVAPATASADCQLAATAGL